MCHVASVTSSLRSICFEVGSFESPFSVPTVLMKVVIALIVRRNFVGCSVSSLSRGLVVRCSVAGWSVVVGGCWGC